MARRYALASLAFAVVTCGAHAVMPDLPDCTNLGPAECNAATKEWGRKLDEHMADTPARKPGWTSECRKDRVTLKTKCTLSDGKLQVFRTAVLGVCFAGPDNSYPGRQAVIRIGNFEPISYEGSVVCGQKAVDIAARLMTEQPGAARGYKWPNGIDEFEFTPSGFKAAFADFERLVKENP